LRDQIASDNERGGHLKFNLGRAGLIVVAILVLSLSACQNDDGGLVESTGTIEATEVDVRSEVGGKVVALHFDEGDRVRRGDILAEIDHEKLDYQLLQAKERLRETEARLALAVEGFRDEEVQKAREFVLETEIQLQDAEREYRRLQKLHDQGVVSPEMKDKAEAAFKSAQKRVEMAKRDYEIAIEGSRKEEIKAAEAARGQAEAAVRLIERQIEDATVVIPVDGVVSERYVELGEVVTTGSLLATVIDLKDIWIMAYVSEKNLGNVAYGQKGIVKVDSFPHKEFAGKVVYISPEAEFTPKNIQTKEERVKLVFGVKIELENPNEELKPGMPADAIIEVPKS
jgi:HlyD family secretion protein